MDHQLRILLLYMQMNQKNGVKLQLRHVLQQPHISAHYLRILLVKLHFV